MATLTPQPVPVDEGLEVTTQAAASGGDEAPTGNGRLLYVRNDHATDPRTVTVVTTASVQGLAVDDVDEAVAAGEVWLLPLTSIFGDPATGRASVTYSDSGADLEVAVLEPPTTR